MKTITATELKNNAGKIIKDVARTGEIVLVTKRGRPLVKVQRAEEAEKPRVLGALTDRTRILGDIVAPIFPEWESLDPNEKKPSRRKR